MTQAPALAATLAEAAPRFGLSRPAGQCFAALWRAATPPDAEALVAATGLSRSAVSTALKELRETGLVQAARLPGSRREGYSAPADPWALVRLLLALALHRDIAPLRDRVRLLAGGPDGADAAALAEVLETVAAWLATLASAAPEALAADMRGGKAASRGKKKKKRA